MSRLFTLAVLAGLITFNSCALENQFSSNWQKDSRFNSESYSKTEANYYNSEDKISLKVFNNDEFIDIILETNSANTLRKIYNLGLSIWLDPDGKSKNTFAVNYPMPIELPYSQFKFNNYLSGFSLIEFNEELVDRFQRCEIIDVKSNESLSINTLEHDNEYQIKLSTNEQVLFSYHIRISIENLYHNKSISNKTVSIGISSINEANEEYYSALSSKEYINKRLDKLKAGTNQNPYELTEWWTNFKLASQP